MHVIFRAGIRLTMVAAATVAATSSYAYSQLVAFGDSLSDDGNLRALLAPFGVNTPASPYFEGRFSNGPVAVEVMARQLGLSLDNRAFGGAFTGSGNKTASPVLAATGMSSQVSQYLKETSNAVSADALYFVWGGGNDLLDLIEKGGSTSQETITQAMTNLGGIVRSLEGAGARSFFVPTQADLGASAIGFQGGELLQTRLRELTLAYNGALRSTMDSLESELGIDILTFDVNPAFLAVSRQIVAVGGTASQPCWTGTYAGTGGSLCADADRHVLFDKVHPTAIVHQHVGQQMAAAVPEPATWVLSFTGLLALGLATRRRALKPAPVSCP